MNSLVTVVQVPRLSVESHAKDEASLSLPEGELYFEDGWVFRQHHGKHVECVCREEHFPGLDRRNSRAGF